MQDARRTLAWSKRQEGKCRRRVPACSGLEGRWRAGRWPSCRSAGGSGARCRPRICATADTCMHIQAAFAPFEDTSNLSALLFICRLQKSVLGTIIRVSTHVYINEHLRSLDASNVSATQEPL